MTHFTARPDQPPEYHGEIWRDMFFAPDVPSITFIEYVSDVWPDRLTPVPDGWPVEAWGECMMSREWHEFTFDLDEGELVLNCECLVSREYDYDDKREYVSVEIIRAPIGKLNVTRDMLCEMYTSEGVTRHEEGKAQVLTEDANDFWNSPEPDSVALYLEERA